MSTWIIDGLETKHYSVVHVAIGKQLVITMCPDDDEFRFNVIFNDFHSFNLADESYRLKFLYETKDMRHGKGVFWKFEDSPQLEDFHSQGLELYGNITFLHYAIYTDNDCIDIISKESPHVQLL